MRSKSIKKIWNGWLLPKSILNYHLRYLEIGMNKSAFTKKKSDPRSLYQKPDPDRPEPPHLAEEDE